MEPLEATYIVCMLCVHVLRRAGTLTFEEKLHILECISFLTRSLDFTINRCSIYNCDTKPKLVYIAE